MLLKKSFVLKNAIYFSSSGYSLWWSETVCAFISGRRNLLCIGYRSYITILKESSGKERNK